MVQETPITCKPRRIYAGRPAAVPGLRAFAASLKITNGHLHAVVTGKRHSPRLKAAYLAWAKEQGYEVPGQE